MRRILKILTSRLLLVTALVILQFYFVFLLVYQSSLFYSTMPVLNIIAGILAVYIINRPSEPYYKIAWIMICLGLPVIGVPLYILTGDRKMPRKLANGTTRASEKMEGLLTCRPDIIERCDEEAKPAFAYGGLRCDFPVYQNTSSRYFKSGEEWLPVYIEELKKAKHFILIECFIIDEGTLWDEVLAVLSAKAAQGVEVKMIYDDFGCITLPVRYEKFLRDKGIEAYRFNHVRPSLIIRMNNRDHRKITVIDNNVAFTGGVNLADEYANRIKRFGYWKDSAIMLKGEAVWSMTVMFLGLFGYVAKKADDIDYEKYHLACEKADDGGFYMPWSDTPTDVEQMAMSVHMNIISHARRYVYIDTPYLILPEAVRSVMCLSAKSGVRVCILVPSVPDKFFVNQITKGSYQRLLEAGVRIYEYTPGFNHCKNLIADDVIATVGSANTDYRSYFLHFENGCLVHHSPQLELIRKDFEDSLALSHEVTIEEVKKTNVVTRIFRAVLNVFIQLV